MNESPMFSHILYVEDEPITRHEFSEVLAGFCSQLTLAENGEQGLKLWLQHKPSLVVSDIRMPVMDGISMVKAIRLHDEHAAVVLITAFSDVDYMLEAIELHADGYLLKPVDFERLEQVLEKISQAQRLLQKNRQQAKQLIEYNQQLQQISQYKTEFMANMSHEIRTPMNTIMGMCYLALENHPEAQIQQYLNKIHHSARTLLSLINDILDFSKIEAGKLSLEHVPFDLDEILDNLNHGMLADAMQRGIEVLFKVPLSVPRRLIGDPLRLEQVLSNLCSNASKFTQRGEITLSIELIEQRDEQLLLQFKVRDTGIGISLLQQQTIFESFHQAESSIARQYGGTGLGLSICAKLVPMLGGDIHVYSQPGKGAEFSFTAGFGYAAEQPNLHLPSNLPAQHVLVVDDHTETREFIAGVLSDLGFEVQSAASGEQAIQLLQQAKQQAQAFALLIVDGQMPGMTGLDVAQHITTHCHDTKPGLILTSSLGGGISLQLAKNAGADRLIYKPFAVSIFFNAVMDVLGYKEHCQRSSYNQGRLSELDLSPIYGARVLLVEDFELNQEVAVGMLQGQQLIVELAVNGRQALDKIRQNPERFDLVLMDLHMPVMDGYQATREIRQHLSAEQLPIIAMTADAMSDDIQRCRDCGMNEHVAKPIDVKQLFTVLLKWISPKPRAQLSIADENGQAMALPAMLPGLNVQAALQRIGNPQRYLKLMQGFMRHYADIGRQLAQLRQKPGVALSLLHNLKGSAGNLGAEAVMRAADVLEYSLLHAQQQELIERRQQALQQALDTLFQQIESLHQSCPAAPAVEALPLPENKGELTERIQQVCLRLKQMELSAEQDWEALKTLLDQHVAAEQIHSIDLAIERLELYRAAEELEQLARCLQKETP